MALKPVLKLGLFAACALPVAAHAQQAFTSSAVNMRAGPAQGYPLVASLPGGMPLTVYGCVDNFTWCDVAAPNVRGWVYANYISYPYQSGMVPIYTYGPALGIPLITFSLGTYWGNYYVGRPWYGNRTYWSSYHPPPPRPYYRPPGWVPPPPPPPRPGYPGSRPPPPPHGGGGHPPPRPPGAGGRPPGGGHGNGGGHPPGGGKPPGGGEGHGGPPPR